MNCGTRCIKGWRLINNQFFLLSFRDQRVFMFSGKWSFIEDVRYRVDCSSLSRLCPPVPKTVVQHSRKKTYPRPGKIVA